MSRRPPFRIARATVFAVVCVTLTCLAHWSASGAGASAGRVAAGFGLVFAFAYTLAGHERSLPTIVGGLLMGQFVLHTLFTMGNLHHAGEQPTVVEGGATAMTGAHLVAALVSAWWLRRGERAAWRLGRLLAAAFAGLLFLIVRAVTGEPGPARPRAAVSVPGPVSVLLRYVLVLRGPPATALVHH
ncbi:hypothetical protein [Spirillospora sp. CA-294931]|uniref:hypothetical protein n=1 Tax=Spirillospora sp. CA-294931 TaxID=3240042 RepID=UPI003D91AF5A